jgi:hypothetical protein
MPSSRPNTIPIVIHLLRQLKPQSILDVGVGFGKWGHLFREYTDILEAEHDPSRYDAKNWRVKIDGIEGHAAYLTPMHEFLYDRIHIGNASVLMKTLPTYDLIFLGDIIEHFEKSAGLELLSDAIQRANLAVIVSTPKYETAQENLCGNELERHRSLWNEEDFLKFPGAAVKTVDGATLLVVVKKPSVPHLELTPPRAPSPEDTLRLRQMREALTTLVPHGQRFVLVDEELLRGSLPHAEAVPFLEKNGEYWGPPGDDVTAIRELERLRAAGAELVVFIWTTFWWLEHYAEFARHLRSKFRCVREDRLLVAFDLRS